MAQNIQLNKAQLTAAISAAQAASSSIDTSVLQWSAQGAESPALEAFVRQFHALEEAMALYQVLLDQDLNAVRGSMNRFVSTDEIQAYSVRNMG